MCSKRLLYSSMMTGSCTFALAGWVISWLHLVPYSKKGPGHVGDSSSPLFNVNKHVTPTHQGPVHQLYWHKCVRQLNSYLLAKY